MRKADQVWADWGKSEGVLGLSKPNLEIGIMREDDLSDLVEVHQAAFSGYMNTRLGPGYVAAFLDWFRKAPDRIAHVARLEDKVVGYVVGAPVGYQARLNLDLAAVVAFALMRRPWLLARRDIAEALVCRMRTLWDGGAKEEWKLESCSGPIMSLVGIGVSPIARGRGVGAGLMSAFEEFSRKRGATGMRLSVYRDNNPARRLYEKHGWEPIETRPARTIYYRKLFSEAGEG